MTKIMIFLKRNIKVVIITGISVFVIAGLSTALIVTNVASARGRDGGRDRNRVRVELTEEQIAEREEHARERLQQRLDDGRITQDEFNERIAAIDSGEYQFSGRSGRSRDRNVERAELTDDQRAERLANAKERLEQRLADGSITQEEYDEKLAGLESGEYPFSSRDRRGSRNREEKSEENN
ncbi:MAG: SHOCT domain-containing protein [Oscillospiraceae bacterium]|nr:SHOCT domain-containing protein [Oscillospiraceae bacterium]